MQIDPTAPHMVPTTESAAPGRPTASDGVTSGSPHLKAHRLGLESQHEPIVLMHRDCPVCRSEGFASRTRVALTIGEKSIIATLFQVGDGFIGIDQAGLSEAAWNGLGAREGDKVRVAHPHPLASLADVRSRLYGHRLDLAGLRQVIQDIAAELYSDVELAAFVAAFASQSFDLEETAALTRAMVEAGDQLSWRAPIVADKHSIGGLPGNRTTPIVVAIAAAAGLTIPKTSSRAITSPAGTADVMEVMTKVDLDLAEMRRVVNRHGGCLAWGGSVRLSPADDIIIRVERALDVDCESQLIASVLSKKIAAGSTHVLLDMPVGPSAKVRSPDEAVALSRHLIDVGATFGLEVKPLLTDGTQPVGRAMGPALEARDVLAVLRNDANAPADLRARSLDLAGALLELGGAALAGNGARRAAHILDSGAALTRFMAICEAQGGFREPGCAPLRREVRSKAVGVVAGFDNRRLARTAKLAGAPRAKTAGLEMHVKLGDHVDEGKSLFSLHGESDGEIAYAEAFAEANRDMIAIETP